MSDPAIAVKGLRKGFGDVAALDGVDFEVPPATVFGLLGPNGAGKTTAVRVLTTILRPDAGEAKVLDLDVVEEAPRVRGRIGLAGQFAAVDGNLTGRENLRLIGRLTHLPRRLIEHRAAELLGQFDLDDAADRPVRTYSGGMRRRLDLCAALVHGPPVLLITGIPVWATPTSTRRSTPIPERRTARSCPPRAAPPNDPNADLTRTPSTPLPDQTHQKPALTSGFRGGR